MGKASHHPHPPFSLGTGRVFSPPNGGWRRRRPADGESRKRERKIEIAISSHLRWENGCCSQKAMCTKERLIPSGIRKGERDKEIIESSSFFFFLAFYYSALTKRWLLLSVHRIFVSPYLFPPLRYTQETNNNDSNRHVFCVGEWVCRVGWERFL